MFTHLHAAERKRLQAPGVAAWVVGLTLLIAGCGSGDSQVGGGGAGDNGVAAKSAEEILAEASTALKAAQSVHLKGTLKEDDRAVSVDLRLGRDAAQGSIVYGPDASVELIKTGGKLYQSASTIAGPQPWEIVPASEQDSTGALLDLGRIADDMLEADGTLNKGATTTVAGQPAIAVQDTDSVLYVATTGTPYPLRVAGSASEDSALDFLDYNTPVAVTPPKDAG